MFSGEKGLLINTVFSTSISMYSTEFIRASDSMHVFYVSLSIIKIEKSYGLHIWKYVTHPRTYTQTLWRKLARAVAAAATIL